MIFFRSFGGGMEMKGGGGGAAVDDDNQQQQQQRNGGFLLPKQQLQRHHDHHQAPLQQQKPECYSEEVDSRRGDTGAADSEHRQPKRQRKSSAKATAPQPPAVKARGPGGGDDGATVEVARRPRGRPPGSKNKPKQPVVITRDADEAPSPAAMRPHVFEVPDGQDVVEALSRFSRRRNLGLCVLGGTGLVSNVILRQPSFSPSPTASTDLSFPGHFEILSISATFLPPSFTTFPPSAWKEGSGGVSVSLAGPHGQVYGGLVAGPVTAAGTVTILAATFCNPTYHRLPAEDEVSVSVSVSVSGGGGGGDVEASRAHASQAPGHQRQQHSTTSHHHQQQQHPQQQQQQPQQQHHHHHQRRRQQEQRSTSPPTPSSAAAAAAAHHHNHHPAAAIAGPTAAEACGMPIYSCHLPSDVLWAPAARSPSY